MTSDPDPASAQAPVQEAPESTPRYFVKTADNPAPQSRPHTIFTTLNPRQNLWPNFTAASTEISLHNHPTMSDLNSWEDDPAAQEENLSRQTQQMNLNNSNQQQQQQGGSFRPGASSFTPGAQSFQPGQNFQQYGGYDQAGYQNYYNSQAAQGYNYPQYGQQGGYNQFQQGGYNATYGQPGYNQAYCEYSCFSTNP